MDIIECIFVCKIKSPDSFCYYVFFPYNKEKWSGFLTGQFSEYGGDAKKARFAEIDKNIQSGYQNEYFVIFSLIYVV